MSTAVLDNNLNVWYVTQKVETDPTPLTIAVAKLNSISQELELQAPVLQQGQFNANWNTAERRVAVIDNHLCIVDSRPWYTSGENIEFRAYTLNTGTSAIEPATNSTP